MENKPTASIDLNPIELQCVMKGLTLLQDEYKCAAHLLRTFDQFVSGDVDIENVTGFLKAKIRGKVKNHKIDAIRRIIYTDSFKEYP